MSHLVANHDDRFSCLTAHILYFLIKDLIFFYIALYQNHKDLFEPHHEKTNNVVSDQVPLKPGCTSTDAG